MRFMMLVYPKGYENGAPEAVPDAKHVIEMGKYNQELTDAGVLRAMDGLDSPVRGARVTFDTGKAVVRDGPFAEAKEVLGGFWVIEVNSREEAIGWAKRAPMTADEFIEVRKVHDYADWPDEVKKEIENFQGLREKAEAKR